MRNSGCGHLTNVVVRERLSPYIVTRGVRVTWMQRLPSLKKYYRHYSAVFDRDPAHATCTPRCDLIESLWVRKDTGEDEEGDTHLLLPYADAVDLAI